MVGEPLADATKRLGDEDLDVKTQEVTSNGVKPGNVVGTEPEAGQKVECQSVVTLLVSKGAKLSTVPDVLGLQEDEAESQIEAAGLLFNVEEEDSDLPGRPGDRAAPRRRQRGEEGLRGGGHRLERSRHVVVPDVEGQPEDTAINQLMSRGATNINVISQDTEDESLDGRVIDQAPSAGSQIRAADRVTLYVGNYVEPDPVDDRSNPTLRTRSIRRPRLHGRERCRP